jgi:predicted MPP superfamily phosphohydrolase
VPLLADGQSLRVGFISDVHVGPTTPARLLDAAFGHLARADLDVLLLGGDYVFLDADEKGAGELAARVHRVPAKRKLAVLGNHDLWTRHELIERALARVGVELLINRSVTLSPPHPALAIVGLDEPWTGDLDVTRAFSGLDREAPVVVLCHSPDGLVDVQRALAALPDRPDVLYVCGHTHGGHIASPWGPVFVPGVVGKRYPSGFHDVGGLKLYVSRGVGGAEVPMRAYAKPEVAVFELISPETSADCEEKSREASVGPW